MAIFTLALAAVLVTSAPATITNTQAKCLRCGGTLGRPEPEVAIKAADIVVEE